jgi:hypothetical protein
MTTDTPLAGTGVLRARERPLTSSEAWAGVEYSSTGSRETRREPELTRGAWIEGADRDVTMTQGET